MRKRNRIHKTILISGSVFGCVGAFLGYMAGFTSEGACGGVSHLIIGRQTYAVGISVNILIFTIKNK
ncbi:MAG: hypothetical protein ACI910_002731 [Oleispira sp.]|jgi:hypothetical protein